MLFRIGAEQMSVERALARPRRSDGQDVSVWLGGSAVGEADHLLADRGVVRGRRLHPLVEDRDGELLAEFFLRLGFPLERPPVLVRQDRLKVSKNGFGRFAVCTETAPDLPAKLAVAVETLGMAKLDKIPISVAVLAEPSKWNTLEHPS